MKLLFLPLDDRPCTSSQVELLCGIGGISVLLPPADLYKSFKPHRFEDMRSWLEHSLPRADAAVISVDQWVYGGLVRSRLPEVSEQECLNRISILESILTHTSVPFYLSSVLLRLSVTIDREHTETDWRNIFDYSVAAGNPSTVELAKKLRQAINPRILERFLGVRERNHAVNLAVAKLSARFTVFGQEDCAPFGLHQAEKKRLQAVMQSNQVIVTGADELGSALSLRAFSDFVGPGALGVDFRFSNQLGPTLVSKYEDISVSENLRLHQELTRVMGPGPTAHVLCFDRDGQKDLCFEKESVGLNRDERAFLNQIKPGDAYLDLKFANGACNSALRLISDNFNPDKLLAFSAWNTTGNRLGTFLSQIGFVQQSQLSGCYDRTKAQLYQRTRLADDWLYQSQLRETLNLYCGKNGWNPWDLGEHAMNVSSLCDEKLKASAEEFGWRLSARLPWPRTFEVYTAIA